LANKLYENKTEPAEKDSSIQLEEENLAENSQKYEMENYKFNFNNRNISFTEENNQDSSLNTLNFDLFKHQSFSLNKNDFSKKIENFVYFDFSVYRKLNKIYVIFNYQ